VKPPLLFGDLFFRLRQAGIPVSLHEWMVLQEALAGGMIRPDLRDFYAVARALLIKDETFFDLWDEVFLAVFGSGDLPPVFSEELLAWLEDPRLPHTFSPEELTRLEALPLERLRELFEQRLKDQKERHDGGNHWIGTGGTSPFGHSGRHPSGIRVGGPGQNSSAIQIAGEHRFQDYRKDRVLDTRGMGLALRKLRRLSRGQGRPELDLDASIEKTCRNAGELELVFQPPRRNQARVLLLMDTGGSMDYFRDLADRLFSAASSLQHWKKFEAFFFHNCPYARIYRSFQLRERFPTAELLRDRPSETFLILVGDASMALSELLSPYGANYYSESCEETGLTWLHRLRSRFPRSVWLNPLPDAYWERGHSIQRIRSLFPMFPLTLEGLEKAVEFLVRGRPAPIPETPSELPSARILS
jgi:uncharacterized protein with von Willebrand factor type A (vWA) domain